MHQLGTVKMAHLNKLASLDTTVDRQTDQVTDKCRVTSVANKKRKVLPFLCQGRTGFRWCMNTLAPAIFKYLVAMISIFQTFFSGDEILPPLQIEMSTQLFLFALLLNWPKLVDCGPVLKLV